MNIIHPIDQKIIQHIKGQKINSIFLEDIELSSVELEQFHNIKSDVEKGIPLDYLIPLHLNSLILNLTTDTLIPRPETQELIEMITKDKLEQNVLVDVGTGSGYIGLSLSSYFNKVILTDVCQSALDIAIMNAKNNNISNVTFFRSDLLENELLQIELKKQSWILVANLPYVPLSDKIFREENNVHHEPEIALYSGEDGLNAFRSLIYQLQMYKIYPVKAFFELDPRNIQQAKKLAEPLFSTYIVSDSLENERFLLCSTPKSR